MDFAYFTYYLFFLNFFLHKKREGLLCPNWHADLVINNTPILGKTWGFPGITGTSPGMVGVKNLPKAVKAPNMASDTIITRLPTWEYPHCRQIT